MRATRRAHLEALAHQHDPEALQTLANLPTAPRLAAHVWGYWRDLHQTRSNNGMSASRLTRQEIRIWEEDEGVHLERWERRAIIAIDGLWVNSTTEGV